MRRIRRKRANATWMPTLGGTHGADPAYFTSFFGGTIEAQSANSGATDIYVSPIVPDYSVFVNNADSDPDGNPQTLADFTQGQDWILKRIVGRISVGVHLIESATPGVTPPFIMIGAGFYVGRADDANQDTPDTNNDEIDVLSSKNIRQPWIWRRTWLMRNGLTGSTLPSDPTAPVDNLEMPGALGPIIDTKIARRIRREERLWFVINAYGGNNYAMDSPGDYSVGGLVDFNLDYRILGNMRKSTNRSTF